jgi:hypothetical protein
VTANESLVADGRRRAHVRARALDPLREKCGRHREVFRDAVPELDVGHTTRTGARGREVPHGLERFNADHRAGKFRVLKGVLAGSGCDVQDARARKDDELVDLLGRLKG